MGDAPRPLRSPTREGPSARGGWGGGLAGRGRRPQPAALVTGDVRGRWSRGRQSGRGGVTVSGEELFPE